MRSGPAALALALVCLQACHGPEDLVEVEAIFEVTEEDPARPWETNRVSASRRGEGV
ncbi:MAG: hypothetical protein ABI682_04500 [Acidobacteriota bacterium]